MILERLNLILMTMERPSEVFREMLANGKLKELFPALARLKAIDQGAKYHKEGDVFEHTMLSIDSLPIEDRTLDVMLAILFHDIGKAYVQGVVNEKDDNVHFYGHSKEGAKVTRKIMERMTDDQGLADCVSMLVEYHMRPLDLARKLNIKILKRLSLKVDIIKLMKVHEADIRGRLIRPELSHIQTILRMYRDIQNKITPIITGKHLIEIFGLKPSPEFGIILKAVYKAQINNQFEGLEEGLRFVKDVISNNSKPPQAS